MSKDLKPCPFCGGKDLSIYIKGIGDKKYAMCCNTCGARGGRKPDKKRATEEWNRRANNDD